MHMAMAFGRGDCMCFSLNGVHHHHHYQQLMNSVQIKCKLQLYESIKHEPFAKQLSYTREVCVYARLYVNHEKMSHTLVLNEFEGVVR